MNKGFKGALIASAVASLFTVGPAFAGKPAKETHTQAKAQANSCSGKSGCGSSADAKNSCGGANGCGASSKSEAKSMHKATKKDAKADAKVDTN